MVANVSNNPLSINLSSFDLCQMSVRCISSPFGELFRTSRKFPRVTQPFATSSTTFDALFSVSKYFINYLQKYVYKRNNLIKSGAGRMTCMYKARRQRSSWARIKLSIKLSETKLCWVQSYDWTNTVSNIQPFSFFKTPLLRKNWHLIHRSGSGFVQIISVRLSANLFRNQLIPMRRIGLSRHYLVVNILQELRA